MKRETRPFVVEVRRGSKKQPAPFMPAPPEAHQSDATLQRAEEILFSRDRGVDDSTTPKGRILESVEPPAPEPAEAEEPQPIARRRGRPPGSKNAAREPIAAGASEGAKPTRGRPRAGAAVRRLELTPELIDAAIATIAKVSPAAAAAGPRPEDEPNWAAVGEEPALLRAGDPSTGDQLDLLDGFIEPDAVETPPAAARRRRPRSADERLQGVDLRRMFKPGERWRGRMLLRALTRRRRG